MSAVDAQAVMDADAVAASARRSNAVQPENVDYDEADAAWLRSMGARAAVAELIAERDRLRQELAWNPPIAWVLRSDDPDPQYDFAVGRECPAGWKGKASPLYDGQGMRPISWQKAVAELIEADTEFDTAGAASIAAAESDSKTREAALCRWRDAKERRRTALASFGAQS